MGKKVLVVITDDPYRNEVAYSGLRYALSCLVADHEVSVFLLAGGVISALKDQAPQEGPNMGKWLQDINEAGGTIIGCGVCLKARGISKEKIFDFVKYGSMTDFVEKSTEADVQMMF